MAALAAPLFIIAGCASMTRQPTYGLDPDGVTLVRQVCADVMGIRSGFVEFDACADSLAQTVRTLNEADVISRTSAHCEREGHEPGTASLAKCVVLSKESVARSGSDGLAPLLAVEGPPTRSYWSASASEQNLRMELSCAHLGLHPATPGFGQCVGRLRNALFSSQNPLL
jgi:hypothetical protein